MRKVGLIVNPVAGMGGSVGLKGTDGGIYKRSVELGAEPVTPQRIRSFLSHIKEMQDILFLVAPKNMGAKYVKEKDLDFEIIGEISGETTAADTKKIAKEMVKSCIDILIFCGGDGTARDIYDAVGLKIPVIGIPSGVKMFSSIFAVNPEAAYNLFKSFLQGTELQEKEVLDIDEDAFREDTLDSKLYGYLKVPKVKNLIQGGKKRSGKKKSESQNKQDIARYVIEEMREDTVYFLGPGTTVKSISDELNITKSLLGIDAVYNKELLEKDVNEKGILVILSKYESAEICISPIGGQGFIFGRGNKQFTPEVIKKIGTENILILSTPNKLKELNCLRVDTGDADTDKMLRGYVKVVVGYNEKELIEVK